MDRLTLKGLSFRGLHGYYEEERQSGNNFEVDLVFSADLRRAGETDNLADTIDYQQASETVRSIMEGPSVKLIETLTKQIGDRLFEQLPNVQRLEVSVRKIHPPLDIKTEYSEIQMIWQR